MDFVTEQVLQYGVIVKNTVLSLANVLKDEGAPGIVVLILVFAAGFVWISARLTFGRRTAMVRDFRGKIEALNKETLVHGREEVTRWATEGAKTGEGQAIADAWEAFNDTLVIDEQLQQPVLRNSARPSAFFNLEDLHFGPGFYRIVPGLFVSVGLALTFLGLVAALQEMAAGQSMNDEAMASLLRIASAKFIMSLSGLVCSIILTIAFRQMTGGLDGELHRLCRALERRMEFASIERIGLEQLKAMVESREHGRALTMQLIAEIGGPLKSELPQAISSSISAAMQPILDKVSQQGTESISSMAHDLSQQVTSGVGKALAQASEHLAAAGDKIGQLADRMDQSSGRMGAEMETSVAKVAQSIDDLRAAMASAVENTSGAFSQGAEQLLATMNVTLQSIRDNTGEGARAISAAAVEMREAAGAMRSEMEGAARSGAEAAKAKMEAAGGEAGDAITTAGRTMLDAFAKTGADIAGMTQALSAKAGEDLIAPIAAISDQLENMVSGLTGSVVEMRRLSEAVRDGAKAGSDAAGTFRGASDALVAAASPVRATTERIEGALRQMTDGTREAVAVVTQTSRNTAEAAAQTLSTARDVIAAERKGVEATLAAVTEMLRRLQGQGERMDTIDEKLGHAFDLYADQTEKAMQAIRSHVQTMANDLNVALSTLQTILDGLQEFQPQQARR